MKNNIFVILVASIIGILLLVVGFRTINKPSYKEISFEDIKSLEEGIVYMGKADKTINKKFKNLNNTYDFDLYLVSDYVIDTVNEYLNDNSVNSIEEEGFVLIYKSKPVWSGSKDYNETELNNMISKYFYGTLLESEIKYTTVTKIDDLISKINSNKYTVFVLGQNKCNYCTMYKPIFNNVVINKNVDIYYVEKEKFTENEFKKFKELKLDIKAECTLTGVAKTTEDSLDYPITMITKKGKTVDCLLGYQSEDKLVAKLGEYNIIK